MATIKMNCDCGKVHDVHQDNDAPKNAISMGCNWCPDCEDTATDYYTEWYNNNDDGDNNQNIEPDVPDNQLILFSVADDVLQNHVVKKELSKNIELLT